MAHCYGIDVTAFLEDTGESRGAGPPRQSEEQLRQCRDFRKVSPTCIEVVQWGVGETWQRWVKRPGDDRFTKETE